MLGEHTPANLWHTGIVFSPQLKLLLRDSGRPSEYYSRGLDMTLYRYSNLPISSSAVLTINSEPMVTQKQEDDSRYEPLTPHIHLRDKPPAPGCS